MPLTGGIYGYPADNEEVSEKRKFRQLPASFDFKYIFGTGY